MPPNREQRERLGSLLDLLDELKGLRSDVEKLDVYRNRVGDSRRDISESWSGGNIPCHLHVHLHARGPNLHAHDLCIAYQRFPHSVPTVRFDDFPPGVPEDPIRVGDEVVGEPGCLHHQLVLVEVRKVSQLAEGVDVPITEFELAAAGLVLVDDYPILRADLVQGGGLLESPEMGIEGRGAILNRELDDLGVAGLFTPGARESRLPNKMVEGASEVVDRVPSNDAPAAYSVFGGCRCDPKDVVSAFRLAIKPNGYSVYRVEGGRGTATRTDFAVKGLNVLFGPGNLGPDAGEVGCVGPGW